MIQRSDRITAIRRLTDAKPTCRSVSGLLLFDKATRGIGLHN